MPIIKSAKKKQRADKVKQKRNDVWRNLLSKALKAARKSPTLPKVAQAAKLLDKLAKKNIIHKNKAARLKSSLSKLVTPKKKETEAKKTKKTS